MFDWIFDIALTCDVVYAYLRRTRGIVVNEPKQTSELKRKFLKKELRPLPTSDAEAGGAEITTKKTEAEVEHKESGDLRMEKEAGLAHLREQVIGG
ncbi:hypothetical protein NL676_019962 [Syzygium grande]|nr:hypothetical protein NL676_019962 [Syzygium grande]